VWDGDGERDGVDGAGELTLISLRAHRVGWRLEGPCVGVIPPPLLSRILRSKPTVWDDDAVGFQWNTIGNLGSKPTVWDGDIRKLRKWLTKVYSFFVPSPLRGMETIP